MTHYTSRKKLPDNVVVHPPEGVIRKSPRPDSIPLGTYGRKKRQVFRASDMSELKSATAWKKEGKGVKPGEKPVVRHSFHPGKHVSYDVYGDWQVE